jgi:hypothetical protein
MDDPKQLINRFVEELWNERRLDVADAIFAKDCVTHQLRSGEPADAVTRGPQAIKEHVGGWIASFAIRLDYFNISLQGLPMGLPFTTRKPTRCPKTVLNGRIFLSWCVDRCHTERGITESSHKTWLSLNCL